MSIYLTITLVIIAFVSLAYLIIGEFNSTDEYPVLEDPTEDIWDDDKVHTENHFH